jgi:hypothetical protein
MMIKDGMSLDILVLFWCTLQHSHFFRRTLTAAALLAATLPELRQQKMRLGPLILAGNK